MSQVLHGQLLDQWGRPIVREMQTEESENLSRIAQLPPNPVASGLTPRKLASLVQSAHNGDLSAISDLGHELETKNGHIHAEISKRKRSVTLLDWSLKPPKNATPQEGKDTEMLEEALKDAPWVNPMLFNAMDAPLKGFSCQELKWNKDSSFKMPDDVIWRPQKMFTVNRDNRNELCIADGSINGLQLRKFGWIQHRAPAMSGYIGETSLTNILAWPFIFASYPIRDMLEFLEIYGIPMRLGKYPAGATDKEKQTLLNAIMSIGHNAGGIIPQGMMIEFQQAAEGGSAEFLQVITWAEKLISKIILGGTLSSQADGVTSTNALGTVHDGARIEIRDSDIAMLEPTITRDLILPMWMLNAKSFSNPKRHPRFEIDTSEPEDLSYYATALPQLVSAGVKIPVSWVHDKLQIPKPEEGEEVLKAPEVANPYAGLSNNVAALSTQSVNRFTQDQNAMEIALANISKDDYAAMGDPLIEPVVAALKHRGLEEAKEVIQELFGELSTEALQEKLATAMICATVMGYQNGDQ